MYLLFTQGMIVLFRNYLLVSLIKRLTYINFDYKTCYAIMQVNQKKPVRKGVLIWVM